MRDLQRFSYIAVLAALAYAPTSLAQFQGLTVQNNSFASSYRLTSEQKSQANITDATASNIEVGLNFERSNWANGSVDEEPFYRVPRNTSGAAPGSLLKLQLDANTSSYTIPPNTALSRIIYQSRSLNGSAVPNSAYVLWPYSPRVESDGNPIVGWAHGTSGGFGNCAPSHIRNLWYQFSAPHTLALQGYVVVAPDYVGLGVDRDANDNPIRHPYFTNPAAANDLIYAVQAAQMAFPGLSKRFVTMGHSQGGGAAWAVAQRQATEPVEGYLGTIAGSPVTSVTAFAKSSSPSVVFIAVLIANGLQDIIPDFNLSTILTPAGIARLRLLTDIQACNAAGTAALNSQDLVQPGWFDEPRVKTFLDSVANGGRPISGPMLVLQGTGDPNIPVELTDKAVNDTCQGYTDSQLQYLRYPGVAHTEVLYASQVRWLDWIADRFAGREQFDGCETTTIESARPYSSYQVRLNWFLEYATQPYETA